MPDYDINIKPGDPATNSLIAEMVTRLTEAEEAHFRNLIAAAWLDGYRQGAEEHHQCGDVCKVPTRPLNPWVPVGSPWASTAPLGDAEDGGR